MNTLFRHIPTNDAELNILIAQQKAAMQKYFGLNLSKQPNKLRDCVCESLGYTNGGYQQLQSEWHARTENLSSDMLTMAFVAPQDVEWNFYVSKEIATPSTLEKVQEVLACLGSESHPINQCKLLMMQAERINEDRTPYSVPVWVYDRIVGYAKTNADAALLAGVLLAARNDLGAPIVLDGAQNALKPQLLLRRSSMRTGLLLEFERVTVANKGDDWQLLVEAPHYGVLTIDFEPKNDLRDEVCWFNGLPCDFMIVYATANGSLLTGLTGGSNEPYVFSRCELIGSSLEVLPLGWEDIDDAITVPLSNKICLSGI